MGLSYLELSEFRNLASVSLTPTLQGFNFIYGANGSGKTSLLEAIYYLSVGRSFRCTQTDRIIRHDSPKMSIFARLYDFGQIIPIGLEREVDGKLKLRVNGENVLSIATLASLTPVQLIDSQCHHLLDAGPLFRRKYLDFGLFYARGDFLRIWRQYERALKQRNAALRRQVSKKELESWTPELVGNALQLDHLRHEYVESLTFLLTQILAELLPISGLKITYLRGWEQAVSYAEVLHKTLEQDYQLGYTQKGPHKADLRILINDIPAKDILSRGQQKLFVCAMILARGALLRSSSNKAPIYLVDDLPSELDGDSRTSLMRLLSKQDAQVFITTTEEPRWYELKEGPLKMFHVEHGKVSEISTSGVIAE